MNKISFSTLALAGAVLVFSSCSKVGQLNEPEDDVLAKSLKHNAKECEAIAYNTTNLSDPSANYLTFQKTVDPASSRVNHIKAGVYSITVQEYLEMDLHWQNNRVAFTSSSAPSDTILIANFDKKGLLKSIVPGNAPNENYLPTKFEYRDGKLSVMKIDFMGSELVSNFRYDRNGNITRIQEQPFNGTDMGYVEYQYQNSAKANGQLYFDEPRGFSKNTFTLAEYLGWLPGLKPVNLRTHTKVVWEEGYEAHDVYYKNHVLDGAGNLVSYEVASSPNDDSYERHQINWTCAPSKNNPKN